MFMPSPAAKSEDRCSNCGALLSASRRHCPTCQTDAGAPNVRACRTEENLKALAGRFEDAKELASGKGCSVEFDTLSELVETQSGVVVAMPARVARSLMEDPNSLYSNYERMVGARARRPASPQNDRHRSAVAGVLFGTYAKNIVYGALSLTKKGVPTYGDVHFRLRSITIDKRTSFLETNSYRSLSHYGINAGDKLPAGYTASWGQRHNLVLAKLAGLLSVGQTEPDWQAILIQSDGKDRHNDDFIEAHIYQGFDRNAVKSTEIQSDKNASREDRLDQELAVTAFNRLIGEAK